MAVIMMLAVHIETANEMLNSHAVALDLWGHLGLFGVRGSSSSVGA